MDEYIRLLENLWTALVFNREGGISIVTLSFKVYM